MLGTPSIWKKLNSVSLLPPAGSVCGQEAEFGATAGLPAQVLRLQAAFRRKAAFWIELLVIR